MPILPETFWRLPDSTLSGRTKLPNPGLPANGRTLEEQPVAEPLDYGRWGVTVHEALRRILRIATRDDISLTVLEWFNRVSRLLSRRVGALIHAG